MVTKTSHDARTLSPKCSIDQGRALHDGGDHETARKHFETVLHQAEVNPGSISDTLVSQAHNRLGHLEWEEGNFPAAEQHFLQSLHPEDESALTAATYAHLGLLYYRKGEYDKAEFNYNSAKNLAKVLMPQSQLMANLYSNRGLLCAALGLLKKSVKLYNKSLDLNKRLNGVPSVQVACDYSNLATELYHLGYFDQAEEHFQTALKMREELLGRDSKQYATTLINYGVFLIEKSCPHEAVDKLEQGLKIREKVFSNKLPLAAPLDYLGTAYQVLGDHVRALECYERSMGIRTASDLGNSYEAAISWRLIAGLKIECDQLEEAQELLERAVTTLTETSPSTKRLADAQQELALLLQNRGDLNGASAYLEKALAIRSKREGSPDYAETNGFLATLRMKQGRFIEANRCYEKVHQSYLKSYGPDSLKVAYNYNNWAILRLEQSHRDDARTNLTEAKEFLSRAHDIQLAAVGSNSKQIAVTFHNMGLVEHRCARVAQSEGEKALSDPATNFAEAKKLLRQAGDINRRIRGPKSGRLAADLHSLASVYHSEGLPLEALCLFEEALRIRQKIYGQDSAVIAPTHLQLGVLHLEAKEFQLARQHFQAALTLDEEPLGSYEEGMKDIQEADAAQREKMRKCGSGSAEYAEARKELARICFRYCDFVYGSDNLRETVNVNNRRDKFGSHEIHQTYLEASNHLYDIAEKLEKHTYLTLDAK